MEKIECGEKIIDTLDARNLLDKNVKTMVESVQYYTVMKSYNAQLNDIELEEDIFLW